MACIPGQTVEIPGSDVACNNLTVRDCLSATSAAFGSASVAGVPIVPGPSFPDIVDNGPGTTVDIINDTRLVVEHSVNGGIAFNCRMPSGNVFCSSQSFPGRAFLSAPEVDFNFFGPGNGPLDLALGAGGIFNDMLVTRSACFGAPPGGGATITGIDRNETGSNPTMQPFAYITLINTGSGNITLGHEQGSSAPQNRFALPLAAPIIIPPQGGVVIARGPGPVTANRWYVVGRNI